MKIEDFYIAIVVFCICYIADFIAIVVDLIAGVRKAKKVGILAQRFSTNRWRGTYLDYRESE